MLKYERNELRAIDFVTALPGCKVLVAAAAVFAFAKALNAPVYAIA